MLITHRGNPSFVTCCLLISATTICFHSASVEAGSNKQKVIEINDENWTQLLEGHWMLNLYAPWCPACKRLGPEWSKFADWQTDLNTKIASADVTKNTGLFGRFLVRSLPTIYHVLDGKFRLYTGKRDSDSLINFIGEKDYRKLDPIPKWLSPNTLQMSVLAYLFKISMLLRDTHNHLVETVGIPVWASYLLFAAATVLFGGTLGFLWVSLIDFYCPARPIGATVATTRQSDDKKKSPKLNDSDLDEPERKQSDAKNKESTDDRLRKRIKE